MKSVMGHFVRLLLVLVATVCSFQVQAYQYTTVDYPGADDTALWGITNSGQALGEAMFADGSTLNFLYDLKKKSFTTLSAPPDAGYIGINQPGVAVGGVPGVAGNLLGIIRDKKGDTTTFSYPGLLDNTQARAVGTSGLVTGYAFNDAQDSFIGFIYDPSRNTYTSFLPSGQTIAQGINSRGQVVGSVLAASGIRYGFLRDSGGAILQFQVNGSTGTRGRGINDSGLITGFIQLPSGDVSGWVGSVSGGSGFQALTVPAGQLLNIPGADGGTFAQAINNSGNVVGGWFDAAGNEHGFVATP